MNRAKIVSGSCLFQASPNSVTTLRTTCSSLVALTVAVDVIVTAIKIPKRLSERVLAVLLLKACSLSPDQFTSRAGSYNFDVHPDGRRSAVLMTPGADSQLVMDMVNFMFNFFYEIRSDL